MAIHEVKGTKGTIPVVREKAQLKLKMVAKLFPCFTLVVVYRVNGA